MKLCDINPFIRYAAISSVAPLPDFTYSYDSRLFYVVGGSCRLIVEEGEYCLSPRDMILWRGGTKYCFRDYADLRVIYFNFDFTQTGSCRTESISPVPADQFDAANLTETEAFTDFSAFHAPLHLKDMQYYQNALTETVEVFHSGKMLKNEIASSILKRILTEVAVHFLYRKSGTLTLVDAVRDYLKINYEKNIANEEIGRLFGYHPHYINRLMLKYTGTTIRRYMIQIRLEKAKELLRESEMPVGEISERCGFKNISYFSGYFKERLGVSPHTYRSEHRNLL